LNAKLAFLILFSKTFFAACGFLVIRNSSNKRPIGTAALNRGAALILTFIVSAKRGAYSSKYGNAFGDSHFLFVFVLGI